MLHSVGAPPYCAVLASQGSLESLAVPVLWLWNDAEELDKCLQQTLCTSLSLREQGDSSTQQVTSGSRSSFAYGIQHHSAGLVQ